MLFKLTCCAFCFQGLDLSEKLKLVSLMGFDMVDLSAKDGDELSQVRMVEAPGPYGHEIRQAGTDIGLKLDELFICIMHDKGEELDVTTSDTAVREQILTQFASYCEFAEAAGFNSICLVPLWPSKENRQEAWDNTVSILKSFNTAATERGLLFNIEPVDFSLLETPDLACEMVQSVPGVGLTLDYSHWVSVEFEQSEIAKMLPHTRHMHIRQAKVGSRQQPVETGTIDFGEVTQRLLNMDFSGNLAIEHIDKIERSKYAPINSPVRQVAELAARVKFTAEHEQVKQAPND
jgi:sugar phosphate isomerase/epimerase